MGILGNEPLRPLEGCGAFYFRVRSRCNDGKFRVFDTAIMTRKTLREAFDSVQRCYPGSEVSALTETDFESDGLPRAIVRTNDSALAKTSSRKQFA